MQDVTPLFVAVVTQSFEDYIKVTEALDPIFCGKSSILPKIPATSAADICVVGSALGFCPRGTLESTSQVKGLHAVHPLLCPEPPVGCTLRFLSSSGPSLEECVLSRTESKCGRDF